MQHNRYKYWSNISLFTVFTVFFFFLNTVCNVLSPQHLGFSVLMKGTLDIQIGLIARSTTVLSSLHESSQVLCSVHVVLTIYAFISHSFFHCFHGAVFVSSCSRLHQAEAVVSSTTSPHHTQCPTPCATLRHAWSSAVS